jgi:hypothetical protein
MADSTEHQFITEALDRSLNEFSETRLLGLREAERRKFDYGCIILRDFSRPLVSQVLWSHEEGIEKDLRTLLFDRESFLKIYFIRDKIRNRARIDEAIRSYAENAATKPLLRGLRIITVPEDFNADRLNDQHWMKRYIKERISADLLFGIVFGKLSASDVKNFSDHGGPLGLKLATLYMIAESGLYDMPTFQKQVGSKSSLREVIAMLKGTGLIMSPARSVQQVPTLKGRFLLDLARRIVFERRTAADWSPETKLIMRHLQIDPPDIRAEVQTRAMRDNPVLDLLCTTHFATGQFGVDIMRDVTFEDPKLYSEFRFSYFTGQNFFGIAASAWDDPDDIQRFQP